MIEVVIDGTKVEVEPGTPILAAAHQAGVAIPSLCNSELVEPYGACRVCSVEIEERGKRKVVTACNYPVRGPLEVFTTSERTMATRKVVFEMMLARWPNVPIVKTMAKAAGVSSPRMGHPQRNDDPNACILCGLCVRLCREGVWHNVLAFEGRGTSRKVVMPFGPQEKHCVGCGACASISPTGAISMVKDPTNPADLDRIRKAGHALTEEMILLDHEQAQMRISGTAHLSEIMNDYDLLPVNNYRFGSHPDAGKIHSRVWIEEYLTQGVADGCYHGCDMSCAHVAEGFLLRTGPDSGTKVMVDGPEYETLGGCGSNMGIFDPHWVLELNYYCDDYGVDTISFATLMAFVMECFEAGVLDKDKTGGLDLSFGQAESLFYGGEKHSHEVQGQTMNEGQAKQ